MAVFCSCAGSGCTVMSQKERKCTAVPPPTGVLKRRSRGSPKSQVRSTTLASKTIIRVLTDRIEANTAAKIAEYTTDVAIESLWSKAQYHVAQRVAFAAMSNQPFDDDRLVALVIFQALPDCAIPVDLARAPAMTAVAPRLRSGQLLNGCGRAWVWRE